MTASISMRLLVVESSPPPHDPLGAVLYYDRRPAAGASRVLQAGAVRVYLDQPGLSPESLARRR